MARRKRRQAGVIAGKATQKELRELSRFVPSLAKIKPRRTASGLYMITPAQKAELTRAKKKLRHTQNLIPVTEKQAKALKKKGLLVGKGVRAIRLRNTSPGAKLKVLKSGVVVTSNGRRWEYHPYPADIDTLSSAGHALIARDDVARIHLWLSKGRANEGFGSAKAWDEYLYQRFAQYVQQQDFVEGIAALIKDKKGSGK